MKQNNNHKEDLPKDEAREAADGKIIHTYATDLGKALKETGAKGQFVKKAIAEAREKEKIAESRYFYSQKNILLVAGGIILVIAGLLAIILSLRKPPAAPPVVVARAIIPIDETMIVSLDGLDRLTFIEEIRQSAEEPLAPGKIRALAFVRNGSLLTSRDFISLFAPSAPATLANFTTSYIFGASGGEPNQIFVLLKTDRPYDYRLALASWDAKILDDLYPFFGLTPSLTLLQTPVVDDFIANFTARTVKQNGQLVLGYAYLDESTVVFTSDLNSLTSVAGRFFQQKIRK
jgi:hypothetical protein